MQSRILALMLAGTAVLYGCSSNPQKTADAAAGASGKSAQTGAESAGAKTGGGFDGKAVGDALSKKVFYFPYDSSDISAADRAALEADARYLAAHPGVKVRIEGNCDERGSREYNLALGERRAQAVQSILLLQGTAKDDTQTVSYGQEKPVATCHDESCWHLNRRVELVYPSS